jgi:beta-mannosidase
LSGRVRAVTGHIKAPILLGWEVGASAPGSIADPSALALASLPWVRVERVPTTAAAALAAAGRWSLDDDARSPARFDADDWWWRVRFSGGLAGDADENDDLVLCLDGIATLAEVWLNGAPIVKSENMFLASETRVTLAVENELLICCRSVDAHLAQKRPRPRWRTPMLEQQQLRWIRTTLLGRTPGWSPPAAPVGPWRPVRIERRRGFAVDDVSLDTHLDGGTGVVDLRARIRGLGESARDPKVTLVVGPTRGDAREHRISLGSEGPHRFRGRLVIPNVARWWPHTHGEPALYGARLEIEGSEADLGMVGFRRVVADTTDGGFALRVNDVRVFCRGACWTPLDVLELHADRRAYDAAVAQVVDAGMNMLRASGATVYESDAFYDAMDAAGVLIWQDLMFANMDYPDDAAFVRSASNEARQQLQRLQGRPCVAVICGNSEVEQQAAMWGASRDRWRPSLFHDTFAALSRELLPKVPYWPSSAHGGDAFPHQANVGTTSYYGVGAYRRPLSDARRAEVRFASECLAFANLPAPGTLLMKARTPRDLGADWDFDDVRDHYLKEVFGLDPAVLRTADHDRYLALGRVVTGEVMAHVFGEWRRARSTCSGGLIWFLRDLWRSAGWGVICANGEPKPAYHYLRRALAPVALHVSDEGTNGLYLHAVNDREASFEGELEVTLFRGDVSVGRGRTDLKLSPHSAAEIAVLALFEGFLDLNQAYRFGPPMCDVVVATLKQADATVEAFYFPTGLPSERSADLGLIASLRRTDGADLDLVLATRSFAQSVAVAIDGYTPRDDYFHLAPGQTKTVRLHPRASNCSLSPSGTVTALNAAAPVRVVLPP